MESLERLQGLYSDLIAFSETRLANIDRLWQELDQSITDFRSLLDKGHPTTEERAAFASKKITANGQEYSINEEFRHLSVAIGNVLDVEEEEAGRLIIETRASREGTDEQSIIADVVSKFHDRRDLLLQSLRLTLEQSLNLEHEEGFREGFQEVVAQILDTKHGVVANGSAYARKCMQTMQEIESWQTKLSEQIRSKAILSQARGQEFYATLEFQRRSLFKQHEALGAILTYLFRGNYATSEDLRKLYTSAQKWQRAEFQWVHYLPAFSAAFRHYGCPDSNSNSEQAHSLNSALIPSRTNAGLPSPYRPLFATLEIWWTVEYSGFYRESAATDNSEEQRSKIVKSALSDGALEFMLSICVSMNSEIWRQPARHELIIMLLEGSSIAWDGVEQTSTFFSSLLMESYETFAEAFITNMPDSIRNLKNEEDDQRLAVLTSLQDGVVMQLAQKEQGARMQMEAFLVLIAFAVEDRPEAAEQFWDDPDSNLYGFLQWASRRQTVPRVSAFCEMICALSQNAESAEAAHKFLLDDSIPIPNTRGKRMPSMNYQQIFTELEFYSRKVHERPPALQLPKQSPGRGEPEMNESESPIMLSCYLRLLSHLCRHTTATRQYILNETGVDLPKSLLNLSSGPIPSYLRASIFGQIESLLTDKDVVTADKVWQIVDEWASTPHDKMPGSNTIQQPVPNPTIHALQGTLSAIATAHDQADGFVKLLTSMIWPLPEASGQPLPFPPDLGTSYRSPGIVPYVDFVCAQLNPKSVSEMAEESNGQGFLRCSNCLDFIIGGLVGFNENYVTKLEKSTSALGSDADYSVMYGQRHPFARIMQWLFSVDMSKAMIRLLHETPDAVVNALSGSPLLNSLQRAIDIFVMVLDMQPTYFDIIKPNVKNIDSQRAIQYTGFTGIEDSIIASPTIILDLCEYTATHHVQLSLKALALLQRLANSSRLHYHHMGQVVPPGKSRRMIDMIGTTGEYETQTIAASLASSFQIDVRELEAGPEADGYLTKDGTMAFLSACLASQPSSTNIAHLLLGFRRVGEVLSLTLQVEDASSLFNAIARLAAEYPDGLEDSLLSWLIHIKTAAITVLQHLWQSSVSSELVMGQLRRGRFLSSEFASLTIVSQATAWDGFSILHPEFWFSTSAEAFAEFLAFRAALYDYVARELRSLSSTNLRSLQQQYLASMQGKTADVDGSVITHPSIFDLFDFAELDTAVALGLPELGFFRDVDFEAYKLEATGDLPRLYDLGGIRAVLYRLSTHISQDYVAANRSLDEGSLTAELDFVLGLLEARNKYTVAQQARIKALHNFVDMVCSVIEFCPIEAGPKAQFILHMLQLILPKMDVYMVDGAPETAELARAADALLFALSNGSKARSQSKIDNNIAERLFQLYRICAEGVPLSTTGPELRGTLYSICSQYLNRILSVADSESYRKARSNSMDCIRSLGPQFINVISDDAEDGLDSCRLHALNLLGLLVSLSRSEKSSLVIETFAKANIIEVLLEPVRDVASEFHTTDPINRSFLLSIFEARMLLLLQISRTRQGAMALLDASLIQVLRDSMMFRADPDLGMDLDSGISGSAIGSFSETMPHADLRATTITTTSEQNSHAAAASALRNYFTLLLSTLRVLLSTFISIGPANEKIVFLIRSFLLDFRPNVVGVFKKALGVNGKIENPVTKKLLEECVKCYTGLAVGCGFVDFEDESALEGVRGGFSDEMDGGRGMTENSSLGNLHSNGGRGFT